jgi:endonuclease/exonuclease/phosphatase family metal-dependent hydrolase
MEDNKKSFSWGKFIYGFFSVPFYVLFALSLSARFLDPEYFSYIGLFGFLFVPLFILQFVVWLYWIRYRRTFFAGLSTLFLMISLFYFRDTFQFFNQSEEKGLKVMTWNVKNFDLYNWSKNKETRSKMLKLIDSVDADIMCFQEFFTDKDQFQNVEAIKNRGYKHCYFQSTYEDKLHNAWGLAIFSKYPITQRKVLKNVFDTKTNNITIKANIKTPKGNYKVYNSHLKSIHFGYEDYDYIHDLKNKHEYDKFKTASILLKMLRAYPKRSLQAKSIVDDMTSDGVEKLIYCCDMNDIPSSHSYGLFRKNMQDAFTEKGCGFSPTYDLAFPFLRIDYIFASKAIEINGYKVLEKSLSDHYPVVCWLY